METRRLFVTSPRIIRRLLIATACAWGLSSTAVRAEIGDEPLPALVGELQQMSPEERDKKIRGFGEALTQGSDAEREDKRQWLKQQWVALSPEQRERLRDQVREHRQREREDRRSERNGERSDEARRDTSYGRDRQQQPQRLAPEDRDEFRQWMRERHGRRG